MKKKPPIELYPHIEECGRVFNVGMYYLNVSSNRSSKSIFIGIRVKPSQLHGLLVQNTDTKFPDKWYSMRDPRDAEHTKYLVCKALLSTPHMKERRKGSTSLLKVMGDSTYMDFVEKVQFLFEALEVHESLRQMGAEPRKLQCGSGSPGWR